MIKIAVDLGSSTTKIYKIGSGIVLSEPSCVAVATNSGKVKAIGSEAKRLVGKTAEFTTIVFPVFEGEIVNESMSAIMLNYFLDKIKVKGGLFSKPEVVFCVQCGATEETRKKYYRLADSCSLGEVSFVETPFLSAMGQNVLLSETNPSFSIDIGGGCANIACFSLDGIIAGISLNIGGGNIDAQIIDHIADKFNLKIGLLSAEKLKMTIASLYDTDNDTMVINGRDISSGKPRSVSVSSSDILIPVKIYIDKIIEYTEMILAKLPAEVSASIWHNGIYLSGGTCNITGVDNYISEKLQIDVNLADEPQMAVVLGGGKVVGNSQILNIIKMKNF